MDYSIRHIRRGSQHAVVLVDDVTTQPTLFAAIYTTRKLATLKYKTQKKELASIKFFYTYWLKKNGVTLDNSLYSANYDISVFFQELNGFFHYLLSKQHLSDDDEIANVQFIGSSITQQTKVSYAEHVRAVARFLKYLNQRYMSLIYQDMSAYQVNKVRDQNEKRLKEIVKEYNKLEVNNSEPSSAYRSITAQQMIQLNNLLLPASPEIVDEDTGEVFEAQDNPSHPYKSPFLQFRSYLINRLMFNYGLRIGEVLLLTLRSFDVSHPDSRGNVKYLLVVQNLPDGVDDPRKEPSTVKTLYSTRVIELDEDDFHYLSVFVENFRNPLFQGKHKKYVRKDHWILFTTDRGKCQPLSYDAVLKSYQKIDKTFISLYPYYRANNPHLDIVKLTPHVGRHTWAYVTLEFIYQELLKDELRLSQEYGIASRMKGLLDAAADQLRGLGGWSELSKMPYKYAKRFVAQVANDSNLKRTDFDKNAIEMPTKALPISNDNNISPVFDEGDYDPFI
ncbi:site-specific integrase [Photobacterium leiognathi]|uniref:site-specific integrase n=1 Tax=Photobacterium leiognathi TaxID=553611 RepID=UPI00298194B2|nr:site-specific integrase [Photobacterium leiognathi]